MSLFGIFGHITRWQVRLLAASFGLVVSLVACGGNDNGPTSPMPTSVPAIANLTATFANTGCIRSADGLAGRALVITFDYTDANGDTTGGRVQLTRTYNTGRSETHFFAVPSDVTVAGTAMSGQIRIGNACPLYNDASSSTELLTLIDAGGFPSNILSATVTRPSGAP
jgi:hypothetical protein